MSVSYEALSMRGGDGQREFQREGRAQTEPLAPGPARAPPSRPLRRQADSAVSPLNADPVVPITADPYADQPLRLWGVVDRLSGVMQKVQENLQDLMFVGVDSRDLLEVAQEDNMVTLESGLQDAERVFHQVAERDFLGQAGDVGVVLLGCHDPLDVAHMVRQKFEFREHGKVLLLKVAAQLGEVR